MLEPFTGNASAWDELFADEVNQRYSQIAGLFRVDLADSFFTHKIPETAADGTRLATKGIGYSEEAVKGWEPRTKLAYNSNIFQSYGESSWKPEKAHSIKITRAHHMFSDQFHLGEKNPEINSMSKYSMFGIGIVMITRMLRLAKVYKVLFNFCIVKLKSS